ncbi:hypothetical protein GCM10012278_46170 [Nonomuraea glycinis]|uniref:Uncharacterized protein n=1 Tax=Nonomuraea glycinis TaxID=2047744 RepID=A0A918A9M4_9ACTN|nr:hypothetical protein GCM10012278_46170 [Nonomuraea glycinis]
MAQILLAHMISSHTDPFPGEKGLPLDTVRDVPITRSQRVIQKTATATAATASASP